MPPEISDSIVYPDTGTSRIVKMRRIVLITGALATIVVGIMYVLDWRNQQGMGLSSGTYILLTTPQSPFTPALKVDVKKKIAVPMSVEGIGTAVLTDMAGSKDKSTYLIANGALTETNVFTSDKSNKKAGLSQRTFSHTTKSSLSYDEQSDSAAYVSVKGKEGDVVTVLLHGTTTEKTYGSGAHPVLLKGGFFVTYQKGNEVLSANVQTKETHVLFTVPDGGSYAIDGSGTRAVVYEPNTHTYQYFSLAGMTGASYETSKKVQGPNLPRFLALTGKTLIDAFALDTGIVFTFNNTKQKVVPVTNPYTYTRITLIHD